MVVFDRPKSLTDREFHYCSGCMHGVVHRLVAEVLDELEIRGKTVGIAPVGCSVFAYNYFNCDMIQSPHGRAPAVATGVKRVHPENAVFTYQGDGDLAAIGTAETVHAAARGENITVIFINNAIYGMTGGQMAPTTMPGQVTSTSPYGRKAEIQGLPIRVCEMLSTLDGVAYAERVSADCVKNIRAAKKAIKKAFEYQIAKKGFTIVEVLSNCPTNWGKSPVESLEWMRTNLMPYYPIGVYKDIELNKKPEVENNA
ncbi:MAG: thiamine pyrophosphate-dependent enzyme [Oscillospiraceae bacterium]|nr:thiamine pyrophosphate-dependent enzyme [Oscillospiraceae bacterium]